MFKMKKITGFIVISLVTALSGIVHAESTTGFYGGVSIAKLELDYKESGYEPSPSVIAFTIGNRITENLAIEARLGTGISDGSDNVMGTDIDLSVDSFVGVYGKAIAPLSDVFELYAMAGYTRGELTLKGMGMKLTDSDSDFSYGVGGSFAVSEKFSINGEYARLFSGDGYDVDSLSLGLQMKF